MSILELMFLETSALTGENVEEAFVQCARKTLNKIESGKRLSINKLPLAPFPLWLSSVAFQYFQECFGQSGLSPCRPAVTTHGLEGLVRG